MRISLGLIFLSLCLGGCLTSPKPLTSASAPLFFKNPQQAVDTPGVAQAERGKPLEAGVAAKGPPNLVDLALGPQRPEDDDLPHRKALNAQIVPEHCRIQDRFDRDDTIAYQWGQNRLGLKVQASESGIQGAFLRFRLKFQPQKTRKEKCRYDSAWQGLAGSVYNEFILREHDTVWQELNVLEDDVRSRFDTLLGN